jgi:pimeloyl-ACP methyl ester carboxylesterase
MPHANIGRCALGFCLSSIVLGCHSEGGTTAADGGPGGNGPSVTLHWSPCDDVPASDVPASGLPVECAQIPVPIDWEAPDGRTISYNLRRIRARGPRRGQLWMLSGGPGESGLTNVWPAESLIAPNFPDLDIYMPDHRGTGRSNFIDCPNDDVSPASLPACLQDLAAHGGKDLPYFSTTQAARDVGHTIDALRVGGEQVFVYGVSYGTYLVNRYLALYPTQPTGAILDSVTTPREDFVHYDGNGNRVGQEFLTACAQDAFCASKVGTDPWDELGRLYDMLDGGYCPDLEAHGIKKDDIKRYFGDSLRVADWRKLIPAFIYRLARCSPTDAEVLEHAVSAYKIAVGDTGAPSSTPAVNTSESSNLMLYNIAFSEGWFPSPAPGLAEVTADENGYYFTREISSDGLRMDDEWTLPRYSVDPSLLQWADTDVPVLLLDGSLDSLTPLFLLDGAKTHFSKAHQRFVALPDSGHENIRFGYPPASAGQEKYGNCAFELMAHFLEDPTAALDTSCASNAPPIDFASGLAPRSQQWFGVDDPYDGVPARADGGVGP